MIVVEQAGALATLQDAGRLGLRRLGIPWAGTLVPHWMQAANTLVGNAPDHVVIECFEGGLVLKATTHPVRVAVAGDAALSIQTHAGWQSVPAWQSLTLSPDERLKVQRTGRWKLAVIAIQGLDVPAQHGSCSTYTRAALGGLDGRALQAQDELPVSPATRHTEQAIKAFGAPALDGDGVLWLRAVPGPQDDHFAPAMVDTFFDQEWQISSEADRMGVRLEGRALQHRDKDARDIVSDAIVPGSVQVPGGGLPIVMLADSHTAGGYPKIATVLSTDLPALGLAPTGTRLRFERVSADQAGELARACYRTHEKALHTLHKVPARASIDLECLTRCNLISGVTDALDDTF